MKKFIIIFLVISLLVLSFYLIMSYVSFSQSSNMHMKLIEKHEKGNRYWGTFEDIYSKRVELIKMDKSTWHELSEGTDYIMSYKHNDLFKTPVIIDVKEID